MSKSNSFRSFSTNKNLLLLILIVIFVISSVIFYLRLSMLNQFLARISYVHTVYLSNNQTKKIIYVKSKDQPGEDVLLTNSSFDPNTAIIISSSLSPSDLRQQTVNYYNKTYFIQGYSTGEGCKDYLIFDEDGKIISKALLQEIDKSQLSIPYICIGSIQDLRDDGKLTLLVSQTNPPQKEYILEIDITSGKLKQVLPKP